MVDSVGKNPTSQGTLPGAHKPIPTLERDVETRAESQVPGFGQAFSEAALTPTAIGSAASTAITQAGVAIAQKQGAYFGQKNPNMQVMPSLTKSDEAFANAYKNESSSILGLQSQKLINENLEQVSQASRLTPELIGSFTQSSAAGIQDIVRNAPDDVRVSLTNQYAGQLQSQTHQLNMRMIGNQKDASVKRNEAFRVEQTSNMQDEIHNQTPRSLENAAKIRDAIYTGIDDSEASGELTATQAQAARISNKLSYESGIQINNAFSAKNQGHLEEFMAGLGQTKIQGLSWEQSETVYDNVSKAVVHVEQAEKRAHALTMAEGNNLIQTKRMTPGKLESMRDDLPPTDFLNLSTAYAVSHHDDSKKNEAVNEIASNPGSALVYNGQTNASINSAFNRLNQDLQRKAEQSGNPISQQESQFQTAATMNHPVPEYTDGLTNAVMGGTLEEAKMAMEHTERLHGMAGFKTVGISDRAKATSQMFRALKGQYPGNEDEALKQAREIVSNKSEEVIALNKTRIDAELGKHRGPQGLTSWAVKMGALGGDDYENLPAFTANTVSQFSAFMQLTNGDVDVSKKMTQDSIGKLYAPSYVNGSKQIAYLPIETMMQIPLGGASLIQSDIIRNVAPQFEQSRKSFDEGNSTSYWRVKGGRVSYPEYAEAKATVGAHLNFKGYLEAARKGTSLKDELRGKSHSAITRLRESYKSDREKIKRYEAASPIEVELVTKGGAKTYTLDVSSSPSTQVSGTTGQVVGRYNVGIKDPETGVVSAMSGYFGGINTNPDVRPNTQWVRERYLSVNGLTDGASFQERWEAHKASRRLTIGELRQMAKEVKREPFFQAPSTVEGLRSKAVRIKKGGE